MASSKSRSRRIPPLSVLLAVALLAGCGSSGESPAGSGYGGAGGASTVGTDAAAKPAGDESRPGQGFSCPVSAEEVSAAIGSEVTVTELAGEEAQRACRFGPGSGAEAPDVIVAESTESLNRIRDLYANPPPEDLVDPVAITDRADLGDGGFLLQTPGKLGTNAYFNSGPKTYAVLVALGFSDGGKQEEKSASAAARRLIDLVDSRL